MSPVSVVHGQALGRHDRPELLMAFARWCTRQTGPVFIVTARAAIRLHDERHYLPAPVAVLEWLRPPWQHAWHILGARLAPAERIAYPRRPPHLDQPP